jgi:hypothetical protein
LEARGAARRDLERLAEMIWLMMLDVGEIEFADKPAVIRFLQEHESTYSVLSALTDL